MAQDLPTKSNITATPGRASCAAIVVASGEGRRFGGMKQYADLQGRRVLDLSLEAARTACDLVVVVVPARRANHSERGADEVIAGGETRSESVRAGLAAIPETYEIVVVHDAVRPLARPELFAEVIDAVRHGADAAIPGIAVVDTLRRRDGKPLGVERDELVAVQTPQAFRASVLRSVHGIGVATDRPGPKPEATDDASLVSAAGGSVVVVPGDHANLKITEATDLIIAEVLASASGRLDSAEITMPAHASQGAQT